MPRRPAVLTLALASPLAISATAADPPGGVQLAQLSIHERIVIRIPPMPPRMPVRSVAASPIRWEEKRAERCLPAASLRAAAITRDGDVDLAVADGRRIRAKLDDDCVTAGFYSSFYVKPAADGTICAKRDAIRSRSGASCPIERFRTLVAKR